MGWIRTDQHREQLLAAQAQAVAKALADPDCDHTKSMRDPRTSEGDRWRMRHIPVIAKGVGGTAPGTNPLAAVLRKDRR